MSETQTLTLSSNFEVPKTLPEVQFPVKEELNAFQPYFRKALKTDTFLLNQIINYMMLSKGKQMRPSLVFLCARLCGQINESSYTAATMIELLHTATLVHDDVVDDAETRRGLLSINRVWKNKVSVLLGDFLLSKGLLVALDRDEFELLKVLSHAVRRMSEGELRQLKASKLLNITEEKYYNIIGDKTASLIAACTECGAIAAGADLETRTKLREIGENIGMAFQIRDDLFDYGDDDTGKPKGNDIQERKITLPMIYALEQVSFFERSKIKKALKKKNKSKDEIQYLLDFVRAHKGVTYARQKMEHYANEAFSILNSFPDNQERSDLYKFLMFVIARKK